MDLESELYLIEEGYWLEGPEHFPDQLGPVPPYLSAGRGCRPLTQR